MPPVTAMVTGTGLADNAWLAVAVAASLALHVVVIYLPILQAAFHTVPLSLADWLIAAGAAATLLVATELAKWAVRARASRRVGLTVSK